MTARIEDVVRAHGRVIAHVKKLAACKEVQGEVHARRHEAAIWILLFDDADLGDAHAAVAEIIASHVPQVGEFDFTVGYYRYDTGRLMALDFLATNRDIASPPALGAIPTVVAKRSSPFDSTDSTRALNDLPTQSRD